jgi:hypothetical protein
MHPTHFRFSAEAHSKLALESIIPPVESTQSELWKTGNSAHEVEDGCTSSLDSYWIDFGGEG